MELRPEARPRPVAILSPATARLIAVCTPSQEYGPAWLVISYGFNAAPFDPVRKMRLRLLEERYRLERSTPSASQRFRVDEASTIYGASLATEVMT